MKRVIKEYRVIIHDDVNMFQKEFTKCIEEFQDEGYELDIKFSTCVTKKNNVVQSAMILCY